MRIKREEAKELLPIIQALAEGKMIQDKIEGVTDWVDTDEIILEYEGQRLKHRIKPETKYRPFENVEECWGGMNNHHDFGWVKSKHNGHYSNISTVCRSCGEERIIVANSSYTLEQAFRIFTFADGTPFGIKE